MHPVEPRPPLVARLRPTFWISVDCLAALVLAAITLTSARYLQSHFDPHHRGYPRPSQLGVVVAVAAVAGSAVALGVRRLSPRRACFLLGVAWLVLVLGAGRFSLATPIGGLMAVVAALVIYQVVVDRPRAWWVLGFGLVLPFAVLVWGTSELRENAVLAEVAMCVAFALGRLVRRNRAYAVEVRDHQKALLKGEMAEERLRIARELHDVMAHSMGVVGVQAGYGHFVMDKRPEATRAALATIQEVSRDTLRELRGMLTMLRSEEGLPPAPTLADLSSLVERMRGAGVAVEVTHDGVRRPLPPGIELSAYRIVQEALTNVAKHAGPEPEARVSIGYGDDVLTLEIANHAAADVSAEPGHGLAGMQERAALYGGVVDAGPTPEGGFRVLATLPLTDPREGEGVRA